MSNAPVARSPTAESKTCCAPSTRATGAPTGLRQRLGDEHVLAVLMDEHQRLLVKLDRLDEIAREDLAGLNHVRRMALLEEVRAIVAALTAAEPHHQREEEVLFPALREHGIQAPPARMVAEHVTLRAHEHRVTEGVARVIEAEGRGWTELMRLARELARFLREHINKEDGVLYPLAFEVLSEPGLWDELKQRCDSIGCCSAH